MAEIRLVIAETKTSTWNYHLRAVADDKLFLGGGAPPSLCGVALGWDTRIPLAAYGMKSHIPERYCDQCRSIASGLGVQVGQGVK